MDIRVILAAIKKNHKPCNKSISISYTVILLFKTLIVTDFEGHSALRYFGNNTLKV